MHGPGVRRHPPHGPARSGAVLPWSRHVGAVDPSLRAELGRTGDTRSGATDLLTQCTRPITFCDVSAMRVVRRGASGYRDHAFVIVLVVLVRPLGKASLTRERAGDDRTQWHLGLARAPRRTGHPWRRLRAFLPPGRGGPRRVGARRHPRAAGSTSTGRRSPSQAGHRPRRHQLDRPGRHRGPDRLGAAGLAQAALRGHRGADRDLRGRALLRHPGPRRLPLGHRPPRRRPGARGEPLRAAIARGRSRSATPVEDEIEILLGGPWDAELEPFRTAGEGTPVRWLHQVV